MFDQVVTSLSAAADRGALAAAAATTAAVINTHVTMPILAHVLITADADSGTLTFRATNLDIEVTCSIPATVASSGAVAVVAALFADYLKRLPAAAHVSLSGGEGSLAVTAGKSSAKLSGLDPREFPDFASASYDCTFSMPPSDLSAILNWPAFAVSKEETRYYLNGIYLHVADGQLVSVATDGHRLARLSTDLPDGAAGMPGVIIPSGAVAQLVKALEGKAAATFAVSPTKVRLSVDGLTIVSKVVDGTYPDYQRILAAAGETQTPVEADVADLRAAVERVATMTESKTGGVRVDLSEDTLLLTGDSSAKGRASEDLAVSYHGEAMTFGLNAKYLREALARIGSENVVLHVSAGRNPVRILDKANPRSVQIIMPCRV